jgi:predicted transcriptional regulator of viral defense system
MKNAIICEIKNAFGELMRKNTYIHFETLYKKYRGYIGTKELCENGFSNRQIAVLTEEGYLEKICHGYYWMTEGGYKKPFDYKCIEISLSNPRAVVCMDSAFYYLGALKEEPEYLSVATARTDRSLMNMNFAIKRHYFSDMNFGLGVMRKETEFGGYYIYDIERSICDKIRLEPELTVEIACRLKNDEQQYQRFLKYADLLRVKQKL